MTAPIFSSELSHTLHHQFFDPTAQPIATLLIVHGMAEHSGRYSLLAQYLADHGVAVLTYDQLGHGLTAANSSELGYFERRHPMQTLLRDVVLMANELKVRHPDVPHFVMGHSMGSFIVRTMLQHHSSEFAGAILMGTSDSDPLASVFLPITKVLNKVKPHYRNSVFAKTTNAILNSKLPDKECNSQYAWVCKNPASRQAYESDPLCGFEFTNNGFFGLFSVMVKGLAKDWAKTIDANFPMLFVSGEEDPIGNMGKGIKTLTKRLQDQGFTHIDQLLYSGMRHEPLHETEREQVYADLLAWIESHSAIEA